MTEGAAISPLWLLGGIASLVAGLVALFWGREAKTPRRVIFAFVFRIGLPMALMLGAPLVILSQLVVLDERIWQALIAGVVIATGWLTTAIFTEIGRTKERAEALRDAHKALYAEIGHTLDAFYGGGEAEREASEIAAHMRSHPDFVPFIPKETHDRVYSALLERIEILPRQTIDAVVAYYSVIQALQAFSEDMRGQTFKDLGQDRRIAMYEDYGQMRLRAYTLGQYALSVISAYSKGGADAAEAVIARTNIPAGGRPGPQAKGSE